MNKKQRSEMTRKEALSVLHKVQNAVGWHLFSPDASEEEKALSEQVFAAFLVLDNAVHPTLATGYSRALCEICYLRLSTRDIVVYVKGKSYSSDCCTVCLEQLKSEKKLAYIGEWDGDNWVKREVAQ